MILYIDLDVCFLFVYYESRKREIKIRLMNESRFDERPKSRVVELRNQRVLLIMNRESEN
jgi:hypothetical protein